MREHSDSILIARMLNPVQVGIYAIGAEVATRCPNTELIATWFAGTHGR
jgi:hypothetical protein